MNRCPPGCGAKSPYFFHMLEEILRASQTLTAAGFEDVTEEFWEEEVDLIAPCVVDFRVQFEVDRTNCNGQKELP